MGLAFLMTSVYGQRESRRAGTRPPRMRPGPPMKQPIFAVRPKEMLMAADQLPPPPWVTVAWNLRLDDATQALYEQMATLASNYIDVPVDRANYYSDFMTNIGSWGGMVTEVQGDANGGYVVKVSVEGLIDQVQLDNDAADILPTTLYGNYSEIYYVDAMNNITYTGPSIPDGSPPHLPLVGIE